VLFVCLCDVVGWGLCGVRFVCGVVRDDKGGRLMIKHVSLCIRVPDHPDVGRMAKIRNQLNGLFY
jgi:hypothetical protein